MYMEDIIKKCKCGVFLTINEHRDYYQSAEKRIKEWRESEIIDEEDIDAELEKRMIETNTIYELQFYPDTPIGSYKVYGTSLEEVIKKGKECLST